MLSEIDIVTSEVSSAQVNGTQHSRLILMLLSQKYTIAKIQVANMSSLYPGKV